MNYNNIHINRIFKILDNKDQIYLIFIFVLAFLSGLLEIAGIASIIPFIGIISDPQYLENKESLNSVPVIVIPERGGNYRLIQGHEMFQALVQAGKEWVIALRIKEEGGSSDQWKYELGISAPKLNICSLDANEFERNYILQEKKVSSS